MSSSTPLCTRALADAIVHIQGRGQAGPVSGREGGVDALHFVVIFAKALLLVISSTAGAAAAVVALPHASTATADVADTVDADAADAAAGGRGVGGWEEVTWRYGRWKKETHGD